MVSTADSNKEASLPCIAKEILTKCTLLYFYYLLNLQNVTCKLDLQPVNCPDRLKKPLLNNVVVKLMHKWLSFSLLNETLRDYKSPVDMGNKSS